MVSKQEQKQRNKLTGVGIAATIGSVVFPPFAPLYIAVAGGALGGAGLRTALGKDSGNQNNEITPTTRQNFYPESPETAVSRGNLNKGSDLLKKLSHQKALIDIHKEATHAFTNYVNKSSSQEVDKITGYQVEYDKPGSLLGAAFGRRRTKVTINKK